MPLSPEEAQIFLDAPCSIKRRDFCVEVGLKKEWDAGMICKGMGSKDEIKSTHDTLKREDQGYRKRMILLRLTDSLIHDVSHGEPCSCTSHSSKPPTLAHIDQTLKLSLYSNRALTLSDIADHATWNWIYGDPHSFFNAFLTEGGTRVLDC